MKFAICCQIKDERRYVKEFVDYHLSIGFDDIYFYEDYGSVSHKDIFIDNPHVHIYTIEDIGIPNFSSTQTQKSLYNNLLKNFKDTNYYDWIAFIDVDEFITFEEGYNLEKLVNEYKDYAGIWLAWKMYNANGHIKRPEGNVMDAYKNPINEKPYQIVDGGNGAKCMWNKKSLVNISKAKNWWTIHCIGDGCDIDYNTNMYLPKIYKKAWINHYFTKSWEDYCDRILNRGNMNNSIRSFDQFFKQNIELMPQMQKLIEEQRYNHAKCTMYLSRKFGIISGGNIKEIENIQNKINNKTYSIIDSNSTIDLIQV